MDQLKKVLEHKFWIMLGLAIIIPFVGWGMTHSAMVAEYEKGKGELEGKFNAIPKGDNLPNEKWSNGSTVENTKQRGSVDETWQSLFDQQQRAKRWPPNFPTDLDQIDTIQQNILLAYPRLYDVEVRRVYALVRPLNETATEGVVDFPFSSLQIVDFSAGAPTKRQILAAQEDLWLYEGLLRAIDRVNAGVDKQFDAPIPVLEELRLLGGSGGPKAGGATTTTTTSGGGGAQGMAGMAMPMSPIAPGGNGDGGFGTTGGGGGGADFEPADEFGPEVDDPTANAPSSPTSSSPTSAMPGAITMPANPMGNGGGGNSNSTKDRYVRKTENWNTRGFYIRVIMDHTEVPHLLAELSNSKEWPIRITRVQTDDVDKEDLSAAGSGQTGRGAGIPSGMMPPGAGMGGFRPPASPMGGAGKIGNPIRPPMGGGAGGGDGEGRSTVNENRYDRTKVAYVTVSGEICLYKRPKNIPAPATPAVAPPPPVAAAPAATPVADPVADPAAVPAASTPAVTPAVPAGTAVPGTVPATAGVPATAPVADGKPAEVKPGETAPAGELAKPPAAAGSPVPAAPAPAAPVPAVPAATAPAATPAAPATSPAKP